VHYLKGPGAAPCKYSVLVLVECRRLVALGVKEACVEGGGGEVCFRGCGSRKIWLMQANAGGGVFGWVWDCQPHCSCGRELGWLWWWIG